MSVLKIAGYRVRKIEGLDHYVSVGCKDITIDELEKFFLWYFCETSKCRFLLWNRFDHICFNIYRSAVAGDITVYDGETYSITEKQLLSLFLLAFA